MKQIASALCFYPSSNEVQCWMSRLLLICSLVSCLSCAEDVIQPESPEANPCALLRCEDKICALVEGIAMCICPQDLYNDGMGNCYPAPVTPPLNPCHESTCPPSQLCAVVEGTPQCVCPEGSSFDDNNECQSLPTDSSPSPCENLLCADNEVCLVEESQARCVCPEDFMLNEEEQCLPPISDPCESLSCPEGQICFFNNGRAYCRCPEDEMISQDGLCIVPEVNPCAAVHCTDNQRCVAIDEDEVQCLCIEGFVYDEAQEQCIEEELLSPLNLCDPNPCTYGNRTICRVENEQAVCDCDFGYISDENDENCTLIMVDPCEPNPCQDPHRNRCVLSEQMAQCVCDHGYEDIDGSCVLEPPANPCEPNPCVMPHRGQCSIQNGLSRCSCDEGFIENEQSGECEPPLLGLCPNSHFDGDSYEPNECNLEATTLSANEAQSHNIMPANDQDWFRFEAIAQHIYRFQVTRTSLANAILYLYDRDGQRILFSQSSTYEITREFSEGGEYFYKVNAYNQRYTGEYTVHLDDLGMDDHGDGPAAATPLTLNALPIDGHIETRGDDDWFSIEAEAGRIYHFELTRGTLSNGYVYIYRPDGLRIAQAHSSPENIQYDIDEAGRWYYRVRHTSSTATGTYQVSVNDIGVDDHSDGLGGATMINTDGQALDGHIETRGDHDYFSIDTEHRHIYRVSLIPLSLGSGYLSLYEPDGSLALSSSSEVILFKADPVGSWSVQVRHLSLANTGEYQLRVEELGEDDHADTVIEASLVNIHESELMGAIETVGDRDYFMVHLEGERSYRLDTTGLDVRTTFYDIDGLTQLGSTGGSSLEINTIMTGNYFIEVRSDLRSNTGVYTLFINE